MTAGDLFESTTSHLWMYDGARAASHANASVR
jgi:hypothetical protein